MAVLNVNDQNRRPGGSVEFHQIQNANLNYSASRSRWEIYGALDLT